MNTFSKVCALIFLSSLYICCSTTPNFVTVYDTSNTTQTNRPVTFNREFAKGEIAICPQPVTGATLSTTNGVVYASNGTPSTNYQADIKNRWSDGSVKIAVVTFLLTVPASGSVNVSFQNNASCANTGFLTQSGMTGFNAGSWDASTSVTAASSTVTKSAKTMLGQTDPGANSFGDCKNDYWLKGSIVTAVIVQDCTATSTNDFGWTFNGTTMATGVTGNDVHATFHPMFILYFYPSTNNVLVEHILETPWVSRQQDQMADIEFKDGAALTSSWKSTGARVATDLSVTQGSATVTSATASFVATDVGLPIAICTATCLTNGTEYAFWSTIKSRTNGTTIVMQDAYDGTTATNQKMWLNLHLAGARYKKTFWSGTAPASIRIDYNFAYLESTKMIPNYDPSISINPDGDQATNGCFYCTSWTTWSQTNKGEIGGTVGISSYPRGSSSNSEGALIQREDLAYLYNGASCGTANSACAKAYQELTGESGAIDTSLTAGNVVGGGGVWNGWANQPFHWRESRATASGGNQSGTNFFYCPLFSNKDVLNNSTDCTGGTGNAVGKALSSHTHSDDQFSYRGPVGVVSGGVQLGTYEGGYEMLQASHWIDFAYIPYLLTGDYFYLEEEYFSASVTLGAQNHGTDYYQANRFFGFINAGYITRTFAWTMQTVGRAQIIAPDTTVESSYYLDQLNSNIETQEGFMGIKGTTLTPTTTNDSCDGTYTHNATNRWSFGHCSALSQCLTGGGGCSVPTPTLHAIGQGQCPGEGVPTIYNATAASGESAQWMNNYVNVVFGHLRELGFSQAQYISNSALQGLEEQIGDSGYNPYLAGEYRTPLKNGSQAITCNNSGTDPFFTTWAGVKAAFVSGEQSRTSFDHTNSCTDHGYGLVARAAAAQAVYFNVDSTDANCPSGVCTSANTYNWLNTHLPYFTNSPIGNTNCSAQGDQQAKFALVPRNADPAPPPVVRVVGHSIGHAF